MTFDSKGRGATSVRLIGSQSEKRWRRALIAEGMSIPTGGARQVSLIDATGAPNPGRAIDSASRFCGTEPLVAVIGMADPLPEVAVPGVALVRLDKLRTEPVVRAIKSAAQGRHMAEATAVRFKALAANGEPFPAVKAEGHGQPAALLTEPNPAVLGLIKDHGWQRLVAPLTSSQTLRLLENHQTSALVVHLASEKEHRIPVLKLIRRQSELASLPVAVIAENWDEQKTESWFAAGADLLARPDELPAVLEHLESFSNRFVCERTARLSLYNACLTNTGEPSPIIGTRHFNRVALEHLTQSDAITFGAIELSIDDQCSDNDLSEAGVYMAMALAPLDLICRPRSNLFLVAMPYADKYYAARTMRTLQTLIEDLKFGQDPDTVLMTAKTSFTEAQDETLETIKARMLADLAKRKDSLLLA